MSEIIKNDRLINSVVIFMVTDFLYLGTFQDNLISTGISDKDIIFYLLLEDQSHNLKWFA